MWNDGRLNPPNEHLAELFKTTLPTDGTMYEYSYVYKGAGNWMHWPQFVRKEMPELNALGLQIPTLDTGRYSKLMEMHIRVSIL